MTETLYLNGLDADKGPEPILSNGAIVLDYSYRQPPLDDEMTAQNGAFAPTNGKVLAFTNGEYVTWCINKNADGRWDVSWGHHFGRLLGRAHRDFVARNI